MVSCSLGPISVSLFGIRNSQLHRQSTCKANVEKSRNNNAANSYNTLIPRGGYADYIGDDDDDDDSPWNNQQNKMQQPVQTDGQDPRHVDPRLQGPGHPQQPYGGGMPNQQSQSPWHQNSFQQQPRQQQPWEDSQNSYNPYGAQEGEDRDEPSLPGEPSLPSQYQQQQPGRLNRGQPQYSPQRGPPGQRSQQMDGYPQQHHLQQQQPQQPQGRYPPPPNLPGYGEQGGWGMQPPGGGRPPHPSVRVQNAHMTSQGPPPGYEEDDEDDWAPFKDDADGDGGIVLPTSAQQEGGGVEDLSQFDKDVIFSGLKRLYRKKIRPLELSSKYGHFHSPPLSPSDFDAKPMVLLLGQYSVGKTSFIRYLLGRDFPGQRIGPEPTTDRFVAIVKGESGDKIIPGAALCSQADRPFRGLSPFGNNFLSRFEGVEMDCPILNNITLVDTPGILSGQKQSIGRNYDYEQVMKWFAERADLIIVMFDAHKLDISDELKRVIELLKPHQDKMRVLLNKADSISTQQLMRVYGALMWSLGKVMMTPEVCRVYMGSFWGAPLKNKEQSALLTQEKLDLFNDIAQLPQNAVMRRINELVKRARAVKVHAYIIHYLRKQLPYTWGKREKQRRLIDRLDREFVMCARRYELPRGDFPELEPFRQALLEIKDLSEIHKLDKKMVKEMDKVFSVDIPNLLEAAKYH
eukprot:scaffold1551_cov206-Alexandrium_tamarense.AAC.7